MSTFDAEVFTKALMADVWSIMSRVPGEPSVRIEIAGLDHDIEATMAALEVERDGRRAQALLRDLDAFLPARKEAILSAAHGRLSVYIVAELDAALAICAKAAVITAKAFISTSRGL